MHNLSPLDMFIEMAKHHVPQRQFTQFQGTFAEWKTLTKPEVIHTLGKWPKPVDPCAEKTSEWVDRGVIKRRYLLRVGNGMSVALQVNLPEGKTGKLPVIFCWSGHDGHGMHGKNAVMGNAGGAAVRASIDEYNFDYGHQMAEAGFATFSIDWIGCGELNDSGKYVHNYGRDWCNLYYLHATMFGMTSLSINLAHGKAATDFVLSLPEIDASKPGVMGLSGGGTMTVWTALTDARFKAAEIICYSDLWAMFGIKNVNYCGMQVAPGLYDLVDVPDLQGLLAPLPLLVDIGAYDECFKMPNAMECFHSAEKIYEAAGAKDLLYLNLFPDSHKWPANKSVEFFERYLNA
ncbi:MAG: hypothetical protein ABI443_00605 [Chthoniobacterales bacterium]